MLGLLNTAFCGTRVLSAFAGSIERNTTFWHREEHFKNISLHIHRYLLVLEFMVGELQGYLQHEYSMLTVTGDSISLVPGPQEIQLACLSTGYKARYSISLSLHWAPGDQEVYLSCVCFNVSMNCLLSTNCGELILHPNFY